MPSAKQVLSPKESINADAEVLKMKEDNQVKESVIEMKKSDEVEEKVNETELEIKEANKEDKEVCESIRHTKNLEAMLSLEVRVIS